MVDEEDVGGREEATRAYLAWWWMRMVLAVKRKQDWEFGTIHSGEVAARVSFATSPNRVSSIRGGVVATRGRCHCLNFPIWPLQALASHLIKVRFLPT